jgi:hypothetical protein
VVLLPPGSSAGASPVLHRRGVRGSGSVPRSRVGLYRWLTSPLHRAAARSEGAAGALAFTGSDSLPLVWIALALLTVGTAFVLAVRRRAQARRNISA